jgi:hypothetical protein
MGSVQAGDHLTAAGLAAFYNALALRLNLLRESRRELNSYLALEFNVFSYIEPDEARLSSLIGELLSKDGSHGQGDLFLRKFLDLLKVRTDFTKAVLRREVRFRDPLGSGGSIDLLIDLDDGRFGIGIENKPRASEQQEQLQRYQAYLEREYADSYCLVYLNGTGKSPISLAEPIRMRLAGEGRFVEMTYPGQFRDWLETCAKDATAEKIRWLLRDFAQFAATQFDGGGLEQ